MGKIWGSSLERHTPLRSKAKWRKPKHQQEFKPRNPIRKISKAHSSRLRKYYQIRDAWLRDHPACGICLVLGQSAAPATEVHHARGRGGSLLFDTRYFVPSCRRHRDFPHDHPKLARELGISAERCDWGRVEK